jgi:hypothetical protein
MTVALDRRGLLFARSTIEISVGIIIFVFIFIYFYLLFSLKPAFSLGFVSRITFALWQIESVQLGNASDSFIQSGTVQYGMVQYVCPQLSPPPIPTQSNSSFMFPPRLPPSASVSPHPLLPSLMITLFLFLSPSSLLPQFSNCVTVHTFLLHAGRLAYSYSSSFFACNIYKIIEVHESLTESSQRIYAALPSPQ